MKPEIVLVLETDDILNDLYRCPVCGHVAPLQCYDVGGSDEGSVFCNACNTEVDL